MKRIKQIFTDFGMVQKQTTQLYKLNTPLSFRRVFEEESFHWSSRKIPRSEDSATQKLGKNGHVSALIEWRTAPWGLSE
jgi:hypothetical protein